MENSNFFKYLTFTKEVIKRDIKKKYYKSVLGILWTVLNPLLSMLVMTFVFSTLFQRNIENYPVYLLCGQITFSFITGASRQSISVIIANGEFIRQMYVPKYIFCLSRVVEAFVDLLFSMVALLIVMIVTGAPFTVNLLLLPVFLVLVFSFTLGLSLITATYGTFFRDLSHLYGIVTTLWMWVSAIFYPITIVPIEYRFVFDINPAFQFITFLRDIIYSGTMPTEKTLIITTGFAVITLLMGVYTFREKQDKFFLYI